MKKFLLRFKNKGLWLALFAFLPLVAQAFGWNMPGNYDQLVNTFMALLVAAGIISNPQEENLCLKNGTCKKDDMQE